MELLADSFRENERFLDNFISEGQLLLSKAHQTELQYQTQKLPNEIIRNLIPDGLKYVLNLPKKYTKPIFKSRISLNSAIDKAMLHEFKFWINRLTQFFNQVSIYTPSISRANSNKLTNRLSNTANKYVHIQTKTRHIIDYLDSLRNKQIITNQLIPNIVKERKTKKSVVQPKRIPTTSSVDVLKPIRTILDDFRKYFGKSEKAMGLLSEKIVKEYFEIQKYKVQETIPQIDQEFKVDLIATRTKEISFIQVKKGQISSKEIHNIFSKASRLFERHPYNGFTKKTITIVSNTFPNNYLDIRDKLMEKTNVDIQYLHSYQIYQKLPKYKFLNR